MTRRKAALCPDSPAPRDQREAQRFTLILRAGKIMTAAGEFLCVLRDVSSGGIKVRLFHPLDLSGQCQIELAGGERYALEPVWQDHDHIGLRFASGPVETSQMLEEAGPFPKRSIRIHLREAIRIALHGGGPPILAELCDISQHGAALRCSERLAIGQHFELLSERFGPIGARIRWRRGDRYGLVFQQSFRLDDLARLIAQLQDQKIAGQALPNLARVNH